MAVNQFNRSSGVRIPRDICTRLKRYLYSAKWSWIIKSDIVCVAGGLREFFQCGVSCRGQHGLCRSFRAMKAETASYVRRLTATLYNIMSSKIYVHLIHKDILTAVDEE